MDLVVLCWLVLMCILSGLSAIAVWSLYKFSAQKSRRAPRRNGDVGVARRERERRATSELAATRAHVHEAPQPPRGACVGKDAKSTDRSPPAFRRHVSDGAVGVGPARGGKKPARLANLQLTERVTAGPRKRPLPLAGSGSLDEATAAPIAHGRSVLKARDATACAPATAPGQSTDSSEPVPARSRRHSMPLPPRSVSFDQAIEHARGAEAALSAVAGGLPVPGSTSPSFRANESPLAPGGRQTPNSLNRMLANDQECPQTPGIPNSPHAIRPLVSSGSRYNASVVRRRLSELGPPPPLELTTY